MTFQLDPRLENGSVFVTDLKVAQVRLSKNAAFPWLQLVPRQNNVTEIFDLSIADQEELFREIRQAAAIVKKIYNPTKLNIATIGNIVPQLHVHVVARFDTDAAWPGPIWGHPAKEVYDEAKLENIVKQLKQEFAA